MMINYKLMDFTSFSPSQKAGYICKERAIWTASVVRIQFTLASIPSVRTSFASSTKQPSHKHHLHDTQLNSVKQV